MLLVAALAGGLVATYAQQEDRLEAPRAASATPLAPTSGELDGKGPADADSYVVTIGDDRALTTAARTTVPAKTGTSLTLDGLEPTTPGNDRYYRVDAVRDDEVRSSRTGRFSLMPAEIKGLKVRAVTAGAVKVTWRAAANARQFDVTIARDKRFTQQATTVRTLDAATRFITKGLKPATKYWIKVRPVNGEQLGPFTAAVSFTTMVRETSFKIGTWNVCSEKCDDYPARARIMAEFLDQNEVDIFGLQEAGGVRVGATTAQIFTGHSRKFVRAEGGAKARYIFYRPALFEQLGGGSFDIGDGRDTTWAEFRVRSTKRTFFYVDVHLDNGKGKSDDSRRAAEMDRMLGRMAQINAAGKPMIYAGDFNSGVHRDHDSPGVKMRAAGFTNTELLAQDVENAQFNTGHTFSTTVPQSGAHIDHVWVSTEFEVESWKQLVRMTNGRYTTPVVSDHNAVSAVVALDAPKKPIGETTPTTTITGTRPPLE